MRVPSEQELTAMISEDKGSLLEHAYANHSLSMIYIYIFSRLLGKPLNLDTNCVWEVCKCVYGRGEGSFIWYMQWQIV